MSVKTLELERLEINSQGYNFLQSFSFVMSIQEHQFSFPEYRTTYIQGSNQELDELQPRVLVVVLPSREPYPFVYSWSLEENQATSGGLTIVLTNCVFQERRQWLRFGC